MEGKFIVVAPMLCFTALHGGVIFFLGEKKEKRIGGMAKSFDKSRLCLTKGEEHGRDER